MFAHRSKNTTRATTPIDLEWWLLLILLLVLCLF